MAFWERAAFGGSCSLSFHVKRLCSITGKPFAMPSAQDDCFLLSEAEEEENDHFRFLVLDGLETGRRLCWLDSWRKLEGGALLLSASLLWLPLLLMLFS